VKVYIPSAKRLRVQTFLNAGKIKKQLSLSVEIVARDVAISAISILENLYLSTAKSHAKLLNQ
jgi:hypothetical protein